MIHLDLVSSPSCEFTLKAIGLAQSNGYNRYISDIDTLYTYVLWQMLFDPEFFQALGRGLGRDKVCDECATGYTAPRDNCMCGMTFPPLTPWGEYAQHRLLDHIQAKGTIEEYFASLLADNKIKG